MRYFLNNIYSISFRKVKVELSNKRCLVYTVKGAYKLVYVTVVL